MKSVLLHQITTHIFGHLQIAYGPYRTWKKKTKENDKNVRKIPWIPVIIFMIVKLSKKQNMMCKCERLMAFWNGKVQGEGQLICMLQKRSDFVLLLYY